MEPWIDLAWGTISAWQESVSKDEDNIEERLTGTNATIVSKSLDALPWTLYKSCLTRTGMPGNSEYIGWSLNKVFFEVSWSIACEMEGSRASTPAKIVCASSAEIGLGAPWNMRDINQLAVNLNIQPTFMNSVALSTAETRVRTSLWIAYVTEGVRKCLWRGVGHERRTKASLKVLVDANAVTSLSSLVTWVEIFWTPSVIAGETAKAPTTREMRKNVVCSMIVGTMEGLWRIRDAAFIL